MSEETTAVVDDEKHTLMGNTINSQHLQSKELELKSLIIRCIDTGWSFVHKKGNAEKVFSDAKDLLDYSMLIKDPVKRLESLKVALDNVVEAGWDHIHTPFSSNNVKNTFSEAKQFSFGDVLQVANMSASKGMSNETKIVVGDGKYTLIHDNGANLRALRHGENWRSLIGDGMVLALCQEIEDLKEKIHNLTMNLPKMRGPTFDCNEKIVTNSIDAYGSNKLVTLEPTNQNQEWSVDICRIGTGFHTVAVKAGTLEQAKEAADELAGNILFSEKNVEYTFEARPIKPQNNLPLEQLIFRKNRP